MKGLLLHSPTHTHRVVALALPATEVYVCLPCGLATTTHATCCDMARVCWFAWWRCCWQCLCRRAIKKQRTFVRCTSGWSQERDTRSCCETEPINQSSQGLVDLDTSTNGTEWIVTGSMVVRASNTGMVSLANNTNTLHVHQDACHPQPQHHDR